MELVGVTQLGLQRLDGESQMKLIFTKPGYVQGKRLTNKLFQENSIFDQDVLLGDFFRHSRGHKHISATEYEDLIGIKDGVTVFVKHNEFIAIFLFNFFAELPYTCFFAISIQLVLLVHPGSEG